MEANNDQHMGMAVGHRATPKECRAYPTLISLLEGFSPLECWSCAISEVLYTGYSTELSGAFLPSLGYMWLKGREVTPNDPVRNPGLLTY